MTTNEQQARARRFHELHHGHEILVLPNAWDAGSARVFELAGARAVATTSAGLAASLGFPDGEYVGRERMLGALERIVETVDVPVSADIEAGYGETVAEVRETVRAVLDCGAVGVNLEDGNAAPEILVEKIGAAREVADQAGVPLFVNARTDVYLRGTGEPGAQLADAVGRMRAYEAAGADGLFVPGLADPETIAELVGAVHRPLNIMARADVPPPAALQRLGVARVSVGSGASQSALGHVRRLAARLFGEGSYAGFTEGAMTWTEVNAMFAESAPRAGSRGARFVERFAARWAGDPAAFAESYHPEARIMSPQTRRWIARYEIAAFAARTRAVLPDMRFEVVRWALRGDALFLEWRTSGTVAGEPVSWEGVDRFILRGERAVEEVVYYDSLPLWERLDPSMKRPGLLEAEAPVTGASGNRSRESRDRT
jgi:2-methylisocitrate lyase-like PEP mutase family enzyme